MQAHSSLSFLFAAGTSLFWALAGCASSEEYRAGQELTAAELARPLEIVRLPLAVDLEVDEATRNFSQSKGPSTIAFSAHSMRLDAGKQLVAGVEEARRLIFAEGPPAGVLKIRLEDFQWEYHYVTGIASSDVVYDMKMKVGAELLDGSGKRIYQKSLEAALRGMGTKGLWEMGLTGEHMVEPLARGNADLVALWARRFAADITKDPAVLAFAGTGGPERPAAQAPEIAIQEPTDGLVTEAGEVRLLGVIRSANPIKEHRITVNGKSLDEVRGVHEIAAEPDRIPFDRIVKLPLGQSVIAVTAASEAGAVAQKLVTVTRREPALAPAAGAPGTRVGERFALVVGLSRYQNEAQGVGPLPGAAEGAARLAEFLKSEKGGGFPEANVFLLVDEQATSAALRHALFVSLQKAIEEDLVLFFFCGHGAPEPGGAANYYLLTYDADPQNLPGTAMPTWDVEMAFNRNVKARRAALFIDACHVPGVGAAEGVRSVGATNLVNRYLKKLAESGEGRALVTATGEGELTARTPGEPEGPGLFTRSLLEALSGRADENLDGVVTLGETIDYLRDMVAAATRGRQRPEVTGKFDRNLPLGVVRGAEGK